ncbi:DNA cytosine methyltransferase [Rubripirellula reticaptiva]|uniref:DNA (cytosine-5-)-methyltransferase n=1 Tax=Rubripirellula reticaptiva TaxID=2528013 RepID=A0A5C6F926_9BACT|nr:DNA cytosine methyltransferase [Rubripirellula reticaptiva]TWU57392.1 Modification methylase HhaI [Rubripirellula reticaptiva]
MSLIELFCGIGGVAEAVRGLDLAPQRIDLVTSRAVDIDLDCGRVYEHNFGNVFDCQTIESIDWDRVRFHKEEPELWWLSPPCQPYCRRGRGRWDDDPRCRAILSLIDWLARRPTGLPDYLGLENVPEFASASHRDRLVDGLEAVGFNIAEIVSCPTSFGIPNRRRRYYLLASHQSAVSIEMPQDSPQKFAIADVLETVPDDASELWMDSQSVAQYASAMDVVDADDRMAVTACFASGYGKSIIRSGSYLRQSGRLRRFSPLEVSRLMGFSAAFTFPPGYSYRKQWKMLGNSLSIPVVQTLLNGLVR